MEKRKIKLSIVILSFDTKELLRKCLESVDRCLVMGDNEKKTTNTQPLAPNTQIIVVDNGSTDGTVEMLGEWSKRIKSTTSTTGIKLLRNRENLGYARGNNVGIKEAKGQYIMILNTDTIIKPGAIEKLVKFLEGNKEADIVGPKLLNGDGTSQANCGRFPDLPVVLVMLFKEHWGSNFVRWSPKVSQSVDWLMGAAFMAKRSVFEKIGGFDERLFMYMEEVEWFYRAKKAGFKAFFLEDSEIVHLGLGSAKSGKKEPILNIYRGLIYYYRKHKSVIELLILKILLKLKALAALLMGYFKRDRYLKETYGEAIKIN